MARVKLDKISKVYDGGVVAVEDVSLDVADKEFVVLVGPSGCGKTTTLRMIAGLEEISSGELYIEDRLVNDVAPKDRDIAMVFQNYALYPHMTVFENMAFGLKLRKYSKQEIDSRVREAAEILGITEYLDRKPKALSGGQRQRVALGRAIVRKPKVFLFDEPLSNLDAKMRVQMRAEISKLHQKLGATMIYVTHDQVEGMTMGDRIVVMKSGAVQQIDTPLNLYNNPVNKFVAGFIGSPAMNFFEGHIRRNGKLFFNEVNDGIKLEIPESVESKLSPYAGKNLYLGIRPEHISIYEYHHGELDAASSLRVDISEPMGNEVYLYFNSPTTQIVARLSTPVDPKPGSELKMYFDTTKAQFFNKENENSILLN
ncbi:MAG TPA: sn-glycerol-3-phosphate ABC transporter ATP-binding protein UgpC [Candidatus Acidoferrales bacterium]|nr:sn-glycerol-3-phosphate ABC transporter ATP-binding protein UgpC [Candidatus Acidoferrales bacterium]